MFILLLLLLPALNFSSVGFLDGESEFANDIILEFHLRDNYDEIPKLSIIGTIR